ncbi:homeobox protein cut-like 1 isoform X1 [Montipora foliosa]|uniref:homeobox protein cut-like 1 isoform X1 n=1 Tax=Montipora foliosa TaxID=591990 RepID=UPI0035F19217
MPAMADGLKERENLYKLMISQLRYDGFESIASTLSKVVNIISACPPMARLHQVVNLGIQAEAEGARPEQPAIPGLTPQVETNRGIDLEYEPEGKDATGEWQSSTADEMFMNNLELQKVDQEAVKDKTEDSPSANMVMQHILRITSDKKLSHLPQLHNAKPIQASHNFVTPNGDVVDAESICEQVKMELVKYSVSQEVFAKAVLGKSQGYLSEMLKHGESFFRPQDHTNYKGWMNFDTMRQFLLKPEAERLRIYYQKGEELKMERLKRRQIEMGLTEDMIKKKRRIIPTEAKAAMEDYYTYNRYLSMDKRQTLANQLAIPEQCVSDFFKNLRSRKKHEDRMKYLLKGLSNDFKQIEQGDSEADSNGLEKSANNQPPCCSGIQSEPEANSGKSAGKPPALIRQCGRRPNIAPAVFAGASPAKEVPETDLVVSKIASLTQGQKLTQKQTRPEEVEYSDTASGDDECHEVTTMHTGTPGHQSTQEGLGHERNGVLSRESSSGVETVQTFSFDSLIDGSMMLHEGTPEHEALDVGRQIYVVHLNNHLETIVRN